MFIGVLDRSVVRFVTLIVTLCVLNWWSFAVDDLVCGLVGGLVGLVVLSIGLS